MATLAQRKAAAAAWLAGNNMPTPVLVGKWYGTFVSAPIVFSGDTYRYGREVYHHDNGPGYIIWAIIADATSYTGYSRITVNFGPAPEWQQVSGKWESYRLDAV